MSPNPVPDARCPFCESQATSHDAGPCLDRWVHEKFLRRDGAAPPYSTLPRKACLDDVINAPRWPATFAVMLTTLGCTVGCLDEESKLDSQHFLNYKIVAAAANLPLAVCRAAVIAPAGNAPLGVK